MPGMAKQNCSLNARPQRVARAAPSTRIAGAPQVASINPPQASPGGFVMESRPGLYESVLVLDYKSLYPSIIRTFLIDPVGLIEGLREQLRTD